MGPHASVAALRELFPEVPRASLEETLRRARRIFRRRHRWLIHTLRWTRPGTVWAIDFTEPPMPVDGVYERVLLVRDLASGKQLLALPCRGEGSEVVLSALQHLFARHGPPLVLKSDNGSAFTSREVQARLHLSGVFSLLSPPRTPEYNGSIEAGIGSLEVRAFYESAVTTGRGSGPAMISPPPRARRTRRPGPPAFTAPRPSTPGTSASRLTAARERHLNRRMNGTTWRNGPAAASPSGAVPRRGVGLSWTGSPSAARSSSEAFFWSEGGELLHRLPPESGDELREEHNPR
jgi:hypothetical protein